MAIEVRQLQRRIVDKMAKTANHANGGDFEDARQCEHCPCIKAFRLCMVGCLREGRPQTASFADVSQLINE